MMPIVVPPSAITYVFTNIRLTTHNNHPQIYSLCHHQRMYSATGRCSWSSAELLAAPESTASETVKATGARALAAAWQDGNV